ncbi:metallophosphoesterase family protein [Acetobacter orientalis]|uniref:Metallophosphoesterase n=1 Tax=Acetobacter orientalis TaxID=146474 RepID=A0A252AZC1_9PROT|nr:metallophosphoesterase [Acetobacter orientalis]OUI97367.1 metallophosphoesterase [Acetobacter orientalis]
MLSYDQATLRRRASFLSAVTLAHLSDLHLPLAGLPSLKEIRFKRVLSLLSWQLRRKHIHLPQTLTCVVKDIRHHNPDMVAMTGDLTNLGLLSEFQAAQAWLSAQDLPPTLLVPGNHDALIRGQAQTKTDLWAPWLRTMENGISLLQHGPVVLIGLNSAIPTAPFLASGCVAPHALEALRPLLRQMGKEGLCRVVLLHHPPVRGLVPRRKGLRQCTQLQQLLREEGAELILHGHSHKASLTFLPETRIPVLGTPSASHCAQLSSRSAGWNAISIQAAKDTWDITVQRRALCMDYKMHDGPSYRFMPHRLSRAMSL